MVLYKKNEKEKGKFLENKWPKLQTKDIQICNKENQWFPGFYSH